MTSRVLLTGLGVVHPACVGGFDAFATYLAAPRVAVRADPAFPGPVAALDPAVLAGLTDETESRRLSRVCQLAVAAGRLALQDAGWEGDDIGLVVGSGFGDLPSTIAFADGYLDAGPAGLSALLFPNTVMNTMAAATAIAVQVRALSLTLNARTVAGELAVARAAAAIAGGRARAVLAGGVDQLDPFLSGMLGELAAANEPRADGAAFLFLESETVARERGARVLGEILAVGSGALPARPHGVGRTAASPLIEDVLERGGIPAESIAWVYTSVAGDPERDAWEQRVLEAAPIPARSPRAALRPLLGDHAGAGALGVAAAAWTAMSRRLPEAAADGPRLAPVERGYGLVHGLARGGIQVAIAVGSADRR